MADTMECETANGAIIHDRRTQEEREATMYYVVATDSFMSGWGRAQGRSLYAVACPDWETVCDVQPRMDHRDDFKRVRVVGAPYSPRLFVGDHLSIVPAKNFTYQPRYNG